MIQLQIRGSRSPVKRRWVGERGARKISMNSCHTGSVGLGLRAVGQNKEFSQ